MNIRVKLPFISKIINIETNSNILVNSIKELCFQ